MFEVVFTLLTMVSVHAAEVLHVQATVETEPVPNSGDAADDPAVWVHPTSPSLSMIIGTDKQGGLATYQLDGTQIAYRPDGNMNNVDIRYGFTLAGEKRAIVTASNRTNNSIAVYTVNPSTRALEPAAARVIKINFAVYGYCMYLSPKTGKYYGFINEKGGTVQQWEFFESNGKIDAKQVRSFRVGGQIEGCAADDDLAKFYVGEERVGVWKYEAEPDGGTARVAVDDIKGKLAADVEGITIYYGAEGKGYLIVSSQGNNQYVVYDRAGRNSYVTTFDIVDGPSIDGTMDTDGIDVVNVSLGSLFPEGAFIAQDFDNNGENQNFKVVPWGKIARPAGLVIDTTARW